MCRQRLSAKKTAAQPRTLDNLAVLPQTAHPTTKQNNHDHLEAANTLVRHASPNVYKATGIGATSKSSASIALQLQSKQGRRLCLTSDLSSSQEKAFMAAVTPAIPQQQN